MRLYCISIFFLAFFCFSVSYAEVTQKTVKANNVFKELDKKFPGQFDVNISSVDVLIEFCPDNTCEAFLFSKTISPNDLFEAISIYMYYFSSYYLLDEWKKDPKTLYNIQGFLKRKKTSKCNSKDMREIARCLLLRMQSKKLLKVFAVRYDENTRSQEEINLAAIAKIK